MPELGAPYSLEALLADVGVMFSLPEVAMRLNDVVNDEHSSAADIGAVISQDPGLTIRLLQIANSPFYGLSREVETVSHAVTLLGAEKIRDLVLATAVTETFEGIPMDHISMGDFWRHSVYCAVIARHLAELSMKARAETLFIAGLLHDIGQLVLYNRLPKQAHEAFLYALGGRGEMDPQAAEREVIGYDHAQIGGGVASLWHLPSVLRECIAFHHDPLNAQDFAQEAALVHIANSVAHLAQIDSRNLRDAPPIIDQAWDAAGLDASIIEPSVQSAQEHIVEVETILFGEKA